MQTFIRVNSFKKFLSISILLTAGVFLLSYAFQAPRIFSVYFGGNYNPKAISSVLFLDIYTMLCFFIIPILISTIVFREKLKDIGLRLPVNNIKNWVLTLLALSLLLPLILLATKYPQFRSYYSYGKMSVFKFCLLQMLALPVYYFCEEFFFRGFLFLNLWKRIGWHSYWLTDFLFFIGHFLKPPLEMLMAIPVGIVLCWLTLETRSIFPSMFVHMSMGLLMNVLINYS